MNANEATWGEGRSKSVLETETDRDRQRQTERDRQRETDRDRQAERDRTIEQRET